MLQNNFQLIARSLCPPHVEIMRNSPSVFLGVRGGAFAGLVTVSPAASFSLLPLSWGHVGNFRLHCE